MDPTRSQRQRPARAARPAVAGIAVDLHRSSEVLEKLLAMLAAAPGRMLMHLVRRVCPGPGPLVGRRPFFATGGSPAQQRISPSTIVLNRSTTWMSSARPLLKKWVRNVEAVLSGIAVAVDMKPSSSCHGGKRRRMPSAGHPIASRSRPDLPSRRSGTRRWRRLRDGGVCSPNSILSRSEYARLR